MTGSWNELLQQKNKERLLDVQDLILLVLREGKIAGKTKLQKEVYLTWKEVLNEKYSVDPAFHPYQFGPFSELVDSMHRTLKLSGKVRIVSKGEGHMTTSILSNGRKQIEIKLAEIELPEGTLDLLKRKKADWDEWTTKGIERYIYRNYPIFRKYTRARELLWE